MAKIPALAFVELALPQPEISVNFLTCWLNLTFWQPQADYWLSDHENRLPGLSAGFACRLGLFRQKTPQDLTYFHKQAVLFFQVADLAPLLEKLESCQGVIKKPPKFLVGFGTYLTVADAAGLCWGVLASALPASA